MWQVSLRQELRQRLLVRSRVSPLSSARAMLNGHGQLAGPRLQVVHVGEHLAPMRDDETVHHAEDAKTDNGTNSRQREDR